MSLAPYTSGYPRVRRSIGTDAPYPGSAATIDYGSAPVLSGNTGYSAPRYRPQQSAPNLTTSAPQYQMSRAPMAGGARPEDYAATGYAQNLAATRLANSPLTPVNHLHAPLPGVADSIRAPFMPDSLNAQASANNQLAAPMYEAQRVRQAEIDRLQTAAYAHGYAAPVLPREQFQANYDIGMAQANAPVMSRLLPAEVQANAHIQGDQAHADLGRYQADQRLAGTQYQSDSRLTGVQATNDTRSDVANSTNASKEGIAAGANASREKVAKGNQDMRRTTAEIAAQAKTAGNVAASGAKAPSPANIAAVLGHAKGLQVPNEKFDASKDVGTGNMPNRFMTADEQKKYAYEFFGMKSPGIGEGPGAIAQPTQAAPQPGGAQHAAKFPTRSQAKQFVDEAGGDPAKAIAAMKAAGLDPTRYAD